MNRLLASVLLSLASTCLPNAAFAAETKAAAKPAIDVSGGEKLFTTGDEKRGIAPCLSCHGAGGNSVGAPNPKLSAQHADYIYKQLSNFKVKPGAQKPERENAVMSVMAAQLMEEEMRNVAAYLSQQARKPAVARNKDTAALGQKIYRGGIAEKSVAACAGCHSPNGAGIPALYPRLQGQIADYTEAQLVAFRGGVRKNSVQMTSIAARLSDGEIKALSDYIAGLR
jgi:cytochrome c553